MKMIKKIYDVIIMTSILFAMVLCAPLLTYAQDSNIDIPEGVYIELTRDFYESLKGEGQRPAKVYTDDPSIEYLKEISISSRFMVETNLQILKQQEQILKLLQSILKDKEK